MSEINPNSFDKDIADAQGANPQNPTPEGTEQKDTVIKTEPETVDYRVKYVESSKEAQRLYKENQEKDRMIESLKQGTPKTPDTNEDLGLDIGNLSPEDQDGLIAYTKLVTKRAEDNILARPAIAFAERTYNESKFNTALDVIVATYPALVPKKAEFKAQYFNPHNVPDNIQEILEPLAKAFLFDKAKDIGAEEAREAADRVQLEDTTGGDRGPTARRSLADWELLSRTDPAKFASLKKEYEADVASGQLQE